MRASLILAILLATFFGIGTSAADHGASAGPPPVVAEKSNGPRFSASQLAYVQSWIRQKAPECPFDVTQAVAEKFLEELQERHPEKLELLLSADFPLRDFESMLLRHVGAKLGGAAQATLREAVAQRRIQALLAAGDKTPVGSSGDAAELMTKIRDLSQVYYRRLLEGRMEDDDLSLLLKKARQTGATPKEVASAKPKVLTASDIVSEFSRRNQVGSAWQRLHAYVVEGRLKSAAGEEQQFLLFKMRPDRLRLVVRAGGVTRFILAADGDRFWQQVSGRPPQLVPGKSVGSRRYMGEFCDPLFVGEGYGFERLEDGVTAERKFYRIAVKRTDGSGYVAGIDPETFHEIARENEDKSGVRYSDFRDVAGVTIAFREEATDPAGHKSVTELTRVTPNPGLIQAFFEPPAELDQSYFEVERFLAQAAPVAGKVPR